MIRKKTASAPVTSQSCDVTQARTANAAMTRQMLRWMPAAMRGWEAHSRCMDLPAADERGLGGGLP